MASSRKVMTAPLRATKRTLGRPAALLWLAALVVSRGDAREVTPTAPQGPPEARPAGQADGTYRAWLLYLPFSLDPQGRLLSPVDARGCEVRLSVDANQDDELGFPCGEPFEPRVGRYRLWLDGPDYVSPSQVILNFTGGASPYPPKEHHSGVVPAGRLALAPEAPLCDSCTFRVVHLDTNRRWGLLQHEFARRATGDRAHAGVLLPAGQAVAGVFDNQEGEYRGLSRPVAVRAGEVSLVAPAPPQKGSDVLVVLDRPKLVAAVEDDDIEVLLAIEESEPTAPDVLIPTSQRVIAIWYGLEGRWAAIGVRSETAFLGPTEISLRTGRVSSFRGELRDRPDLEVRLDLPDSLNEAELGLEVQRPSDRSAVRTLALEPGTTLTTLADLPPEPLRVLVTATPWTFTENVDLSDGVSSVLVVAPTPLTVSGRVFLGAEPHAATVAFAQPGRPVVTSTTADEDGEYSAELFSPGPYAVTVDVTGGAPRAKLLKLALIMSDTELDIHVPDNRFAVRVVEEATRQGIAGAKVTALNRWEEEVVSRLYVADGEGGVALPPIRPGLLTVSATADGYMPSKEIEHWVGEDERQRTLEVVLKRQDDDVEVHVLLPDGRPAAGAEAIIVRDLEQYPPSWQGSADAEGAIALPPIRSLALLLIRHPMAGFAILELPRAIDARGEATVSLPAAGPPLAVRAVDAGEGTSRAAAVCLWTGSAGGWARGLPLTWLTWTHSDGIAVDGVWVGRGIPAGPVRLAAWKARDAPPPASSVIDALGATIPFPWPSPTDVQTIE